MQNQITEIQQQIADFQIDNKEQLETFRIVYVGRKGVIGDLFDGLKNVPQEDRRTVGQELNALKELAQNKFNEFQTLMESSQDKSVAIEFDLTLPNIPNENGTIHPLTLVRARIIEIFAKMGFNVSDGPEIESDFYNFTALNFAENHPAREMQDTFFIEKKGGEVADDILLRTHTSNVQIRLMQNQKLVARCPHDPDDRRPIDRTEDVRVDLARVLDAPRAGNPVEVDRQDHELTRIRGVMPVGRRDHLHGPVGAVDEPLGIERRRPQGSVGVGGLPPCARAHVIRQPRLRFSHPRRTAGRARAPAAR